MSTKRIRVLLVDDSPTARAALRLALARDPALEIVGEAADGESAARLVGELAPDLVTMDVFLRAENGLDVAARIMASKATPIVVVTASDPREPGLLFRAMQAGVLDVSEKLPSPTHPDYESKRARLVRTLRALASVPVVHRSAAGTGRRGGVPAAPARGPEATRPARDEVPTPSRASAPEPATIADEGLLLLGASTGGPPVLAGLLRALPKPFPVPIALVQHMTPGFIHGFATWLAADTGHRVVVVEGARPLEAGVVHVASDECHLVLESTRRVGVSHASARGFHRPSIDVLFESVAVTPLAARTVAVLLSGMGSDGARGLATLRAAGASTIAQKPSTCSVSSMPTRAIELGAPMQVLEPASMPGAIAARFGRN